MSGRSPAWTSSPLPAVIHRGVFDEEALGRIREVVARSPSQRETRLDRGSYVGTELARGDRVIERLVETLHALAEATTGRTFAEAPRRIHAITLEAGDYVLLRADRVAEDDPVEIILDVSESPTTGAEVHYRHRGQVYFVVPSEPGLVALVERGPTVLANHTYVSRRFPSARVVRVVARYA